MARLVFPDDRTAFRPGASGQPIRSARGATAQVFLDAAASQPANDLLQLDDVPVVGGQLYVDASSLLPLFKGPADGRDVLYVVIDGGPATAIYARVDDRLDALAAQIGALTASTLSADTAAAAALAAEVSRATTAENAARAATTAEATRAAAAEAAEAATRASADATAAAGTAAEAATRAAADAAAASAAALDAAALTAEAARATAAEQAEIALRAALAALEASDHAAEQTAIGNEAGTRASAVAAEQQRAVGAEAALTSSIAANTAAIALRAPLASPAFTGTPTKNGSPILSQAELSGTYLSVLMPQKFGAAPDALEAGDGTMTASSAVLTKTVLGEFVPSDVGKMVIVVGAGSSGGQLTSTIVSYQSPTQVTLADAASTTVVSPMIAWGTDNTTAMDAAFTAAAAIRNGTVHLPSGGYMYNGSGYGSTYPRIIFDAGEAGATVYLGTNKSLVVSPGGGTPGQIKGMHLDHPRTVGGFGCVRLTYPSANSVSARFLVENCRLEYFTGTGVSALSSDTPFWRITGTMNGRNGDSTIGVALNGLNDDCLIDVAFLGMRVDIKLARGGNNARIRGSHVSMGAYPGFPRIPIWFTPNVGTSNAGDGMDCTAFKFGNENYDSRDYRVVYADEDAASGADFATRLPNFAADSTGYVIGHSFHDINVSGAGGTGGPVVYSTTPNVHGLRISGELQGTLPSYIVQFRTPPTADRNTQDSIIGPFYGSQLGTETVLFPPVSNAVGFGRVIDPAGLFATRDTEVLLNRAADPVDYVNLLPTAIRSFTLGGSATRSNVADAYGGTDAAEVTFPAGGLTYTALTLANVTVGVPVWIEFDVKAGSSSPLAAMRSFIQYTSNGATHWRRIFTIPTAGTVRHRFLWTPREKTTTILLGFDPNGVAGSVVIGRVRCYHSREPQNVDGYTLVGTSTPQRPLVTGQARKTAAMTSGKYYKPVSIGQSTVAMTTGTLHASAIDLAPGITLSRIAAEVTVVGTAGAALRLGIYSDNNGVPGTLLLDAGTIDATSATAQEVTINQTIAQGGRYWLAALCETAGSTVRRFTAPAEAGSSLAEVMGSVLFGMCGYATAGGVAAGSLPATFPAFSFNSNAATVAVKVA